MTHRVIHLAIALAVLVWLPARAEDRFFDSNGVQIRYVEQGSGEPIVLVHGYLGNLGSWIERGIFGKLAERYRVIAMDCRGHGKSGKPHDPKQYGPEMGRDVVRLLDHLKIQRAHIIGYSMGGSITTQLLTLSPERFLSATLGGAPGRLGWTAEDERRMETEAAEMEQGSNRSMALRLAPANGPKPTEAEIRERSEQVLAGQDRVALAAVRRSNRDQVVTAAQMGAVRVPTLGIVGSADPNLDGFRRLQTAMPRLKLVVVEGGSHGSTPTRPDFLSAVLEFLAAHPAASHGKR